MTAPASAEQAQALFYEAFARSNAAAMMQVWSGADDIICIHPGSAALNGFDAIRRSWELILANQSMQIQATPVDGWITDDTATLVVVEHLYVPSQNLRGETLATNAFRREGDAWRMVLHHGSSKPAAPQPGGTANDGVVH